MKNAVKKNEVDFAHRQTVHMKNLINHNMKLF